MTAAATINCLLLLGLILLVYDSRPDRAWSRACAILFMQAILFGYMLWRFEATLPVFSWSANAVWPWGFFIAEVLVVTYESWTLMVLLRFTNHSPQADTYEERLRRDRANLPSVDIFVPCYSEGEQILEETIRGALALDYPRDRVRVWILDDGGRPWLETLCKKYDVGYFARPTHEHGKAGNLNYALPRTQGEFILLIDADFILEPNFLFRTLGFLLYEEGIGLVQTPQHFRNPDPVQHNLMGHSAWTEEQHFFMTVAEPARDGYDNAFCVGSGWIIRRQLVEELGGFPCQSICEDLEISYVLKARGYRTLFLNETLAYGLAPESVAEYIKQRVRWCSGSLQHLYISTGPLRARGLTVLDRLFYLEPIVFWLTYPLTQMVVLAPLVFWFTGIPAIQDSSESAGMVLLPRFLASMIISYWLSDGKVQMLVAAIHKMLPMFHVTAAVAKSLVAPFGRPFQVTTKGQDRDRVVVQWPVMFIFLTLIGVLTTGMLMNLTGYYEIVPLSHLTALDTAWTFYTLLLLTLCAVSAVELPKGRDYIDAKKETVRGSPLGLVKALASRLLR